MKKSTEEILNSKETYERVLSVLSKYGGTKEWLSVIANGDFIAGGSVANILISMFHGNLPIINDIDIYHQVTDTTQPLNATWYPTVFVNEEGLEIIDDSYGRVYVAENGARMRVTKHSRRNIFNIVEYLYENRSYDHLGRVRNNKSREIVVLEGFDLNCCKAAIDLVNQKLVYTPDFVEYLETEILRITNPCSPIQTAIRLHKKIKDLHPICDIEHEMRFLTVATNNIKNGQLTQFIGPETYTKYLKMKDTIDQYFLIRRPKNNSEIPIGLKRLGKSEIQNLNIWIFEPKINFDIHENVTTINTLKRVWELLYTAKDPLEQDKINTIFYKNVLLGKTDEDTWERIVYVTDHTTFSDSVLQQKKSKPYYNSSRYTHNMLLVKKNYHQCDFTLEQVDFIDQQMEKTRFAIKGFLNSCETLIEQYNLITTINDLLKKEGSWVLDFLHQMPNHDFVKNKIFGYDALLNTKSITKEIIERIIKQEKEIRKLRGMMKIKLKRHKMVRYSLFDLDDSIFDDTTFGGPPLPF